LSTSDKTQSCRRVLPNNNIIYQGSSVVATGRLYTNRRSRRCVLRMIIIRLPSLFTTSYSSTTMNSTCQRICVETLQLSDYKVSQNRYYYDLFILFNSSKSLSDSRIKSFPRVHKVARHIQLETLTSSSLFSISSTSQISTLFLFAVVLLTGPSAAAFTPDAAYKMRSFGLVTSKNVPTTTTSSPQQQQPQPNRNMQLSLIGQQERKQERKAVNSPPAFEDYMAVRQRSLRRLLDQINL